MHHTPQLFNSAERKGRGTDGGGITGQVGGVHGDTSLHIGPQLDHATTAKLRMGRHRDKWESATTQRVPGIKDRDGLLRCYAVSYRGSYLVGVCFALDSPAVTGPSSSRQFFMAKWQDYLTRHRYQSARTVTKGEEQEGRTT